MVLYMYDNRKLLQTKHIILIDRQSVWWEGELECEL